MSLPHENKYGWQGQTFLLSAVIHVVNVCHTILPFCADDNLHFTAAINDLFAALSCRENGNRQQMLRSSGLFQPVDLT